MVNELEVLPDIEESLLHNTRIGEGDHTILERGHISILTSKQLKCPPTGIMEERVRRALFKGLRVSSYQGIRVKRQHCHITLNSYLSMFPKTDLGRNTINGISGGRHVDIRGRKEY
jgi:hypothetical protein